MGCRSHWIHVVCGGFCSECQPLSPAIVDTVKSIYSSTGTGTEVASKIRRSSDRSPLSVKQSQLAKRLQDSSGNSIFDWFKFCFVFSDWVSQICLFENILRVHWGIRGGQDSFRVSRWGGYSLIFHQSKLAGLNLVLAFMNF